MRILSEYFVSMSLIAILKNLETITIIEEADVVGSVEVSGDLKVA